MKVGDLVNHELGRIYWENRRGLYGFALSITRRAADAEDAVQDAFARLCKMRGRQEVSVAYVFAAVRNAALDRVRGRREDSPCPLPSWIEAAGSAASDRERDVAIARAVDELPQELREPVFLRAFGGLTFREIADLTQTPLQTAVSRYHAGLRQLAPALEKWL
jgi:RNA polymerase sigma-70 factor (ECF subfamily)